MWTEYLNRLLGVTVGFFILGATISAWRHHRRDPHILWPTVVALLLTGYEGWLGGRVVAHELAPWIVTAHLVVAIVIVLLLLYATVYALYRRPALAVAGLRAWSLTTSPDGARAHRARRDHRGCMMLVTLAQVALGTQVRGSIDDALHAGVAREAALGTVGMFDSAHRTAGAGRDVAGAHVAARRVVEAPATSSGWRGGPMRSSAWRRCRSSSASLLAFVALAPPFQVLHLTVASLLMGAQMVQLLVAWWE